LILNNTAIAHADLTRALCRDGQVMGYHNNGGTPFMQCQQQLHDTGTISRIKRPGGFICQQQCRVTRKRSRNGNPLFFPAGKLMGQVGQTLAKPNAPQCGVSALAPLG
jgi:hypothetical protein